MLHVFGVNGLTAYFGMIDIGRPSAGETVLVTGAAGGVGSIASQIGTALDCRVIGTAGGPEKCRWVTETAGLASCIDYKAEDVDARLRELAPDGIDVVFDNVGGSTLEAALANIATHARIVISGGVSSGYRSGFYGATPRNYMELAFRRARMEGFIFLDYLSQFPEALGRLVAWVNEGKIVVREHVAEGLESTRPRCRGCSKAETWGSSSSGWPTKTPDNEGVRAPAQYPGSPDMSALSQWSRSRSSFSRRAASALPNVLRPAMSQIHWRTIVPLENRVHVHSLRPARIAPDRRRPAIAGCDP